MKLNLILLAIILAFLNGCSTTKHYNYSPNEYIYNICDSEVSLFYKVDEIPKSIMNKLQKSSKINFLLANPNEDYLLSTDIVIYNLPFRRLVFFGKSNIGTNIICYETSGYEKRAIIYKIFNGKIIGTFSILFDDDSVDVTNFKEYLKENKYKIVDIYN